MRLFLVILLCFSLRSETFAWGNIGHRIVAKIAYDSLTKSEVKKLEQIMGKELIEDAANWPDFIRSAPGTEATFPWHYINVPKGKKFAELDRDTKKGDIVSAIENQLSILKNKKSTMREKRDAIAWLTHLVGDIHQPLHAGYPEDWGGNKINVTWFSNEANLHQVWDEKLIEMQNLSYTEYVKFINHPEAKEIDTWLSQMSAGVWTDESHALLSLVYDFPKDAKKYWEYDYFYRCKETLDKRLLMAGYRLGKLLKENL
jgi:hypothetical protein